MEEIKQGYKQTDIGTFPEDWEITTIDQVIKDISMGPFGSDIKVSNFVSEGVPVLNGLNVSERKLVGIHSNFVTIEKARSLKKAVARKGDIVITHRGTIGQISIIPFNAKFDNYVISQSQFRITVNDKKVDPEYLVLYFHSNSGQSTILESKGHTGVPAIAQPTTTFRKFSFPLPPLKEQIQIVKTLNDTDALIAALDKKIAKKQQIKQGAMQQLLTGKKRLPGFSGEWVEKKLGECADINRGGSPRPIENYLTTDVNGINWIKIGDVGVNAKYIESTDEKIISEGIINSRYVKEGDFLLSNSMSFGRPYILKINGCIHDGWLVIQNYQEAFDINYLYYILGFESTLNQYKSVAAGSSVLNLNKQIVSNVSIAVPLKSEQTAIAQILTDMDNEIARLEKKRDKYKEIKAGMMQVLLTGKIRLIK